MLKKARGSGKVLMKINMNDFEINAISIYKGDDIQYNSKHK